MERFELWLFSIIKSNVDAYLREFDQLTRSNHNYLFNEDVLIQCIENAKYHDTLNKGYLEHELNEPVVKYLSHYKGSQTRLDVSICIAPNIEYNVDKFFIFEYLKTQYVSVEAFQYIKSNFNKILT